MEKQLRIWRVVPTCITGVQAPTFFVETTESNREKAEKSAQNQANSFCTLSRFQDWDCIVSKTNLRKDQFGRYEKYHQ